MFQEMRSPLEYGYGCNDFSSFLLFMKRPGFVRQKHFFYHIPGMQGGRSNQIQPDPTRIRTAPARYRAARSRIRLKKGPHPRTLPSSIKSSSISIYYIVIWRSYMATCAVFKSQRRRCLSGSYRCCPMPIRLISMLSDPTRPDPADHRSGAGQAPVRRKSRPAQITRICFRR